MSRRGYHDLANAVVEQAVWDYRRALDGISYNVKPAEVIVKELEDFFHSKWYRMLTKVDGDFLISALRKEHIEKEKERKKQLCESN